MSDITIIGGCGHVGLPLGLAFARAGKKVVALDLDARKVEMAMAGKMPFADAGADELLPKVLHAGTFRCTTDPKSIREAEVVITVVGTPLDEHLNPRFEVYADLLDQDRSHLRKGQLLVLRSTVYPGTTERVAEGVALEEITSLPQIVAGTTPKAQERAESLFRVLTPDLVPMKPLGAELAKLYNNAWRYIQFAVANQFYMICNDQGVDFYDVHRAMTEKYPRAKGFPTARMSGNRASSAA